MSRRRSVFVVLVAAFVLAVGATPALAQERNVSVDFDTGTYDPARKDWPITAVRVSGDLDRGQSFTVELRDGSGGVLWSGSASYQPPATSIDVSTFVAVSDVEEAAIAQRRPGGGTSPDPTDPTDPADPDPTDPDPPDPTDPADPDPTDPPGPTDPSGPVGPGGPGAPDGPVVGGDVITRPARFPAGDDPATDGDPEVDAIDDQDDQDEVAAGATPPGAPPSVAGDAVNRPEQLPQQGNGAGGAGQLALSMVIAVVFVAILFRTPLPSATTVRWRK